MENLMERTIVVHAKEVKVDKLNFVACSAKIKENWYKIKFTKECPTTPKKKGLYDMTISLDDCSIEKGKKVKGKNGKEFTTNPTIWVRNVINLRAYTEEELKKINRDAMTEAFDGDLPF